AVGLQAKGQAVTLEDIQLLRHFAWTAAEQASHERGLIGAALSSGGNMDPAALEQLAVHRGEVELAWAAVLNLAGMPEMPAAIRSAVAAADEAYFKSFAPRRDDI